MRPTASGFAWRTEYQKASAVCPLRVRPERSVMVPEIMTGSLRSLRRKNSSTANSAAFAFRVSKTVSTMMMSAPPSTRPSSAAR